MALVYLQGIQFSVSISNQRLSVIRHAYTKQDLGKFSMHRGFFDF